MGRLPVTDIPPDVLAVRASKKQGCEPPTGCSTWPAAIPLCRGDRAADIRSHARSARRDHRPRPHFGALIAPMRAGTCLGADAEGNAEIQVRLAACPASIAPRPAAPCRRASDWAPPADIQRQYARAARVGLARN
jgi:hypothetical protein